FVLTNPEGWWELAVDWKLIEDVEEKTEEKNVKHSDSFNRTPAVSIWEGVVPTTAEPDHLL
ncbi:unnamed protein product, partial [Orchesella dallaii]